MPTEPEKGPNAQYRSNMDSYHKWADEDRSARYIMLSCMHDNPIREVEKYPIAKELC